MFSRPWIELLTNKDELDIQNLHLKEKSTENFIIHNSNTASWLKGQKKWTMIWFNFDDAREWSKGDFLGLWDSKGQKNQGSKKTPESLRVITFKLNVKTHLSFSKKERKENFLLHT